MKPRSTRNCAPLFDDTKAAAMLGALGSPARLTIYRALLRAGDAGLNVVSLQRAIGIPASTLAHHISTLAAAGVISQQRTGRELVCRAQYAEIRKLSAFLLQECCADAPVHLLKSLGVAA